MRLIGEFQSEKEAFGFQTFLQNHGVPSVYDNQQTLYRVWVIEEDDFDKACAFYDDWKKNPATVPPPEKPGGPHSTGHPAWRVRMDVPRLKSPFSLNNFVIILCGFLFILMLTQMTRLQQSQGEIALEYELVPLQQNLMFDYPSYILDETKFLQDHHVKTSEDLKALPLQTRDAFEKIQKKSTTWKGVTEMIVTHDSSLYDKLPPGTLFEKIRQGEVWRLISPVLLHGSILHILFNMLWLFVLGRQIEERIGKLRYLFLSLLIGVISNVAQYLMSGPIFLGYSGIIMGMVGFIWMRQKIAPWEGYPLQRPVITFITVFVLAMLALEIVSMALQFFHVTEMFANIANTAHIVGAVVGALLGRLSLFERSHP